jgi:predicted kinase
MPPIVLAGPPCSGKTTIALELARCLELPHLSMDAVRARILPDAAHTRADRQVAYRAMHLAAELLLRAGAGAILDAPYGHAEDREELARIAAATARRRSVVSRHAEDREELARIAGAELRLIECRVSPETAVRRFRARGPDPIRLDLTEELVFATARDYIYTHAGLLLDTDSLSLEECCSRAMAFL